MGGDADQGHRRGIGVRQQRGGGIEPVLVNRGILRRDSLAAEQPLVRAPDAIARLEPRALGPTFSIVPARSQAST